ncbi:MAG: type II secretion system protein [bacterium]
MENKKSFTIVELLVVMAVIGVLLSLAVFGIQALQKSQRETQRLQDLKNIQGELQSYYSKYKRYPIYDVGLQVDTSTNEFVLLKPSTSDYGVDANVFSRIPIQSLTAVKYYAGYDAANCTTEDTANNETHDLTASADTWYVLYSAADFAQEYGLFGCTENGRTINYGGRPN